MDRNTCQQAVRNLMENVQGMTVQQVRDHVRPSRTSDPHDHLEITGVNYILAEATEDQLDVFRARMGNRVVQQEFTLPKTPMPAGWRPPAFARCETK
jgi:L-asparaginase II